MSYQDFSAPQSPGPNLSGQMSSAWQTSQPTPPQQKRRAPWFIIIATVLVVAIMAELAYVGWHFLGKPDPASASYAPRQSTSVAIQSLQNTKIDTGFVFHEAAGVETHMRRQKIESGDQYLTAAFNYRNYRIIRLAGVNNQNEDAGAIIGVLDDGSLSAPAFEVPVSPDATCTIEEHVITCDDQQQLNLATVTDSIDQALHAEDKPASSTTSAPSSPAATGAATTDASSGSQTPAFTYDRDYAAAVRYPLAVDDPAAGDFKITDSTVTAQGVVLSESLETTTPMWVFAYPGRTSSWWPGSGKDTTNHLVITPTKLVAVIDGVKAWEHQPAAGFSELNDLDTNPKVTLVGSTLIFATNDGITGLDATTGEVVWTITTKVESWALDTGNVLVTDGTNLTTFKLNPESAPDQAQALTPTQPEPQNLPLTLEDFKNGTYEVPALEVDEKLTKGTKLTFVDGKADAKQMSFPYSAYSPYYATPIMRDGKIYTLVSMMYSSGTAHFHYSWGIYDHDRNLIDSFSNNNWPKGTVMYGYPNALRLSVPKVFGSLIQITSPQVAFKGDPDGGCRFAKCSGAFTLNIRWTGDGFVAEDTTLTMDGKPLMPPKNEDVQALLDAWAKDDPELARPHITELDAFMKDRNLALGACTNSSCYWGNIIFKGQEGRLVECNTAPVNNGLMGTSLGNDKFQSNSIERGAFVCTFDSAFQKLDSQHSWDAHNWLVVTTDETGHIKSARMERDYS